MGLHVTVELCVVPMGVGVSVSSHVTACERVLREAGLEPHAHAFGTNVEGEWEHVFAAVRRCHEVLHERGVPRLHTTLKVGTRTDRPQSLADKVRSVGAEEGGEARGTSG